MAKYLMLNDIGAYKIAFHLSNYVWTIFWKWDYVVQKTICTQFVNATDSISANIAEGFWRHTKKDKIHFYHYSLGSIGESLDWNEKARIRKLLTKEQYQHIFTELQKLPREVRYLIKFTQEKLVE